MIGPGTGPLSQRALARKHATTCGSVRRCHYVHDPGGRVRGVGIAAPRDAKVSPGAAVLSQLLENLAWNGRPISPRSDAATFFELVRAVFTVLPVRILGRRFNRFIWVTSMVDWSTIGKLESIR